MRKLRTLLILLLAIFLIAAGAYLPRIAAAVQDGQTLGHTATEPMQSLVLELGGEAQAPGYMMRKLALEQNMMTIPISAGEASMTQEDVFAAAEKGMEGYIEAGMFEWFEYNFRSAEPYLGIDADDKSNFTVFWSVTLDYQGDPYQYLFLHIDDETGKILYINYVTYADDQFKYYYPDNQQLMMEDFVSTYFSQLDLTDLADYPSRWNYIKLGIQGYTQKLIQDAHSKGFSAGYKSGYETGVYDTHLRLIQSNRICFRVCRVAVHANTVQNQITVLHIGGRDFFLNIVLPECLLKIDHFFLISHITPDLTDNDFILCVAVQAAKEYPVIVRNSHIVSALQLIINWHNFPAIQPPMILCVIIGRLDLQQRNRTVRELYKVVHIGQHELIL